MEKWLLLYLLFILAGCQPEQHEERIISLMPSNTEILYAMGLEQEIVGVTTNDDYPQDVKNKERFDSFNLNKEQLLRAKPSVIVTHESARMSQQKVLDSLEKNGIKIVYIREAKKLEEIDDTIRQVGEAVDHKKQGQKLAAQVNQDIKTIVSKYKHLPEHKVFIEVSSAPDIYTAGHYTLLDDMVTKLGSNNVFHDMAGWQPVAMETVIRRKPELMLSVTGAPQAEYQSIVDKRPNLKAKAVSLNDDWLTRPGPRIGKGMEQLAKALND